MLAGELLFRRAVLVALQKLFRGAELNRAGIGEPLVLEGALKAFFVEPERGVGDPRLRGDPVHDLVGIRHARHVLRIDE